PASSAWPTAARAGPASRPPRALSTPPDRTRRPPMAPAADPPLDRIELRPIGHVRTAHRRLEDTPIQTTRNPDEPGRLIVLDQYAGGLGGLGGFDYAHLVCFLDRAWQADGGAAKPFTGDRLRPVPFLLQHLGQRVGVFATRAPVRPNYLALSLVRVVAVQGNTVDFTVRAPPGRARLHPGQRLARPGPRRLVPAARRRRRPPRPSHPPRPPGRRPGPRPAARARNRPNPGGQREGRGPPTHPPPPPPAASGAPSWPRSPSTWPASRSSRRSPAPPRSVSASPRASPSPCSSRPPRSCSVSTTDRRHRAQRA